MRKGSGKCQIDAVELGELTLSTLTGVLSGHFKYALVGTKSKVRYGSGTLTAQELSSTSYKLVQDLISSIERDVCKLVFTGGSDAVDDEDSGILYSKDEVPQL